jgi:hypothetical protein
MLAISGPVKAPRGTLHHAKCARLPRAVEFGIDSANRRADYSAPEDYPGFSGSWVIAIAGRSL